MLGAMVGDICGSVYEGRRYAGGDWDMPLFTDRSRFTDDSVLTAACFEALRDIRAGSEAHDAFRDRFQEYGKRYPRAGYGRAFREWIGNPVPYGSWGNGSAMRVSPIAWLCDNLENTLEMAEKSARVSHDHPEGVKGARAVAMAIYLARNGASKDEIRTKIAGTCGYDLRRTLKSIRENGYRWSSSCQGSVPEAIIAFLDSSDFESAIRGAIWLGGDADTQAAIAGSIAEAYYGEVPAAMLEQTRKCMDGHLNWVVEEWLGRER